MGTAYHYVMQACGFASGLLIGLVALVVFVNVVTRNVGLGSAAWVLEGSEYAVATATFLGAPWVLYQAAHVRIDLLLSVIPASVGRWLESLVNLLGMVISGTLGYFMWQVAGEYLARGSQVYKAVVFPEWWAYIFPVLCFTLLVLEFGRRLWRCAARGEF